MSSMEPLEANGNNAAIPSSVNPVEAMAIATSLDAASTNVPTTPKDTADAHQANTAVGTSETVSNKGEQVEAKPTKVAVTVTPTDQLAPTENMENGVVEGATGSTTAVTPANVAKESTQAVDEDKCVGDNEADNVKDKEKDMDVKGDEATDVKRDEVKNAGENTKGNDAKGEEEVEPKPKRRKVVYIPIPRASPRLASRAAAKEKEEAAATQDPKPKDEEEEEDGDDGNFVPSSSSGKRGAKRAYGKEGQDNHPHSHYPILMPKEFTPAHEDWIRIRYTETIGKFRAKRTIDDFEDHYRVRVVNPHVSADARMAECLITNVFRRHEKRLRLRAAGEENTEPKKWKYGPRFKKPQVKLSMTKTKKPQPDIWEPSKKIKTETSAPLPPQRASTRTTAASKRAAQDAAARAAAKKSHTEDAVALLSLSAAAESASNAAAAAAAAQSSGTVAQPAAATSSRSQVPACIARVMGPAPRWQMEAVVDEQLKEFCQDDFEGKYVIMLFYPSIEEAMLKELSAFSNASSSLALLNCQVLVVCAGSAFSNLDALKKCAAKGNIGGVSIPVLGDKEKTMFYEFGVAFESEVGCGLFVISPTKRILQATIRADMPSVPRVEEILRTLKDLQPEIQDVSPTNVKEKIAYFESGANSQSSEVSASATPNVTATAADQPGPTAQEPHTLRVQSTVDQQAPAVGQVLTDASTPATML